MVALGLTLIFGILDISHFAHGHLYMVGAYLLYVVMVLGGINYWLALIICMAALAVAGVAVERVVYRPLRGKPGINSFIAAIGLILVLESLVGGIQPNTLSVPQPIDSTVHFLGTTMEVQRLIVIFGAIFFIVLLQLFIKRTRLGTAIEAMSQDREGASMVGINVNRMSALTFALATALAAAAAVMMAPLAFLSPGMGSTLILKAFVIVVIGGLGSMKGAIFGGYILGILEALAIAYVSSAYKDVFAFGILIVILAIRPTGLFKGREAT
ncbi:MAG: ABC transporter permease [Actinobacteria bacterium RBG_19FT_COMBO_54_7]|uniref:ABC transporter permease n=1 Tax=Candidatus Solincola sediminis TaxID=1797199 RepID=A0A1F2WFG1_9ACTN|nr:MAG: ABC transporter permease [Candidatus Solincola sediminis]OFW68596.1 MAG: ABC transporter permease [Actinobacteria bacterium RBG_19FT_COMBO_54_7]